MIAEARKAQLDVAAQVPFTKSGDHIQETRQRIQEIIEDEAETEMDRSGSALESLTDMMELG